MLAVTDSASPQPMYYEYDAVSNRTKLTLPTTSNSTVVTYTYDALNRLTGIRQGVNLQPTALAQYTYTLSASGNREQVVEARNGAPTTTRSWSYDDGYRLLTEVRQDTGFSAITTAYNYDKTGNRLRQSVTNGASPALVTNYTYNELDQLTSVISGSQVTGYSYDRRGNLLQMGSGSGATSYRWDALDRLTVITTPGGTLTHEYDASGKRTKQVAGGVTTNYLWDEFSPYGDVLLETNVNGQFGARYALAGGELLSQKRSDGTFSYYLKDGQGSVRSLLSQVGSITDQYDYTAFGEIASRTGSTANPYQYTGQQYDTLSGLYSLRARYYNPAQGRFLSKDTYPVNRNMPQELNRYGYVANNPLNLVDPTGLHGSAGAAEAAKPNPGGSEYGMLQGILNGLALISLTALGATATCLLALDISMLINAFGGDGGDIPAPDQCKARNPNGRITLWRAVSKAEYESLSKKPFFWSPSWYPFGIISKYFSRTREGAIQQAQNFYGLPISKEEGPYYLVSTTIHKNAIHWYNKVDVDQGIETVVLWQWQYGALSEAVLHGEIPNLKNPLPEA